MGKEIKEETTAAEIGDIISDALMEHLKPVVEKIREAALNVSREGYVEVCFIGENASKAK